MVCVSPGMLDTKVIVAPNSPRARANANTAPAMMPGNVSGSVTVKNVHVRLAPSVAAASSNLRSTASIEILIAPTRSGKAITPQARAAPVQRNEKTMPMLARASPNNPLRPNASSNRYPVTTGGRTSGRYMIALTRAFPGKSLRANTHAMAMPNGKAIAVDTAATRNDSATAVHSSADNSNTRRLRHWFVQEVEAVLFEDCFGSRCTQELEILRSTRLLALGCCCNGVSHRRVGPIRERADNLDLRFDLGVGLVHDPDRSLAARNECKCCANIFRLRKLWLRGLPGAE